MMIKKFIALACIAGMSMLCITGCTNQNETNNSTIENENNVNNGASDVGYIYDTGPVENSVIYIETGETGNYSNGEKADYNIAVKDAIITDNLSGLTGIMGQEDEKEIEKLCKRDNKTDKNGTPVVSGMYGTEKAFVSIKLSITNNSDNKCVFNSMYVRLYEIEEDSYINLLSGFQYLNMYDGDNELNTSDMTLESGEEKEIVITGIMDRYKIKDNIQSGGGNIEEATEEFAWDSLYIVYCSKENYFSDGMNLFKLKVRQVWQ